MHFFVVFFLTVSAIYAIATLLLSYGWVKLPTYSIGKSTNPLPYPITISVIIPVRNEAENLPALLHDLSLQSYPHFEVIVVNDQSTDHTVDVVGKFAQTATFKLQCIDLEEDNQNKSHKKRAILLGVNRATGQWIVTTDGDCRVLPAWLETLADFINHRNPVLVSSWVGYSEADSWFEALQRIEFASLVGAGAASMSLGKPNMCNGANLAFSKQAFFEVGGYAGNEHVASGDDEFLMHKMVKQFPNRVMFLKSKDTIVLTKGHRTWRGFYQQRKRWGSKWRHYDNLAAKATAIAVFGMHGVFTLGIVGLIMGVLPAWGIGPGLLLRFLTEFVYLLPLLRFGGFFNHWYLIFPLQWVHSFYIVYIALAGLRGNYHWKGREIKP